MNELWQIEVSQSGHRWIVENAVSGEQAALLLEFYKTIYDDVKIVAKDCLPVKWKGERR